MQVLVLLRMLPTSTPEKLIPLIKPEAQHVWSMHLTGALRSIHFLQAPGAAFPMGVSILLEADSAEHAATLIHALPMVSHGLVSTEILPLAPFTSYAALFADAPH